MCSSALYDLDGHGQQAFWVAFKLDEGHLGERRVPAELGAVQHDAYDAVAGRAEGQVFEKRPPAAPALLRAPNDPTPSAPRLSQPMSP